MVEILKIDEIIKNGERADFVRIYFVTDAGTEATTRYAIQNVYENGEVSAGLKRYVWEKAKFIDEKAEFVPMTKKITITKNDFIEVREPTEEEIFAQKVSELENAKRHLELGLITQEEYDVKLSEVKESESEIKK